MHTSSQRSGEPSQMFSRNSTHYVLLGLLFLLSGVAGLIYELVWFRLLTTTFGATGPALAATTAAFMAGLGAGSLLSGSRADRLHSPAAVYALLEVLIAVSAFCVPGMIGLLERLQAVLNLPPGASLARDTSEFVVIFLVLLVPTGLMGATLPVLSRAVVNREESLGKRFAWLYGINTLGAALGAVLAGFYMIPEWGVGTTSHAAMALNVAAGLGALLLVSFTKTPSRDVERNAADPELPASGGVDSQSRTGNWDVPILLGVFMTGFASLAAQYHWTRCLVFAFDRLKNTTYSFAAVLGVMLTGLVVGSMGIQLLIDRQKAPRRLFSALVIGLGISMGASACVLVTFPQIVDVIDPQTLRVDFSLALQQVIERTAWVIGVPTVFMGAALPVAVRCVAHQENVGKAVGRLYAVNTTGAVAGAIASAFLLAPLAGLVQGIVLLGITTAVTGVWILAGKSRTLSYTSLLLGGVIWFSLSLLPEETWVLQNLRPGEKIVGYRDGILATVCVIESANGERRICVDDVPVAGTSNIMQTDQKSLAHWGMFFSDRGERALTVGFGSGGASYSFLLHDRLKQLDCVEICPEVPQFAELLREANHGLLDDPDPRYRIIYADARAYLRRTRESYDVIVSDCTDLRYRSSANLYDREYFELCRNRLTPGGCVVIWMPLGGLSPESFAMTLRTFMSVYKDSAVFYMHNRWTHYVILIGKEERIKIDIEHIKGISPQESIANDLAEIGMTNPYKIAATFLTSSSAVLPILGEGEMNTEDRPRLEFAVPRFDTGPWSAQRNLNLLRHLKVPAELVLAPGTASKDAIQVQKYSRSAALILAAQESERRFQIEEATRHYLEAFRTTPDDEALKTALEFPALRQLAEQGNPTAWLFLGRSLQIQNQPGPAAQMIDRYFEQLSALSVPQTPEEQEFLRQGEAWRSTAGQWRSEINLQLESHK